MLLLLQERRKYGALGWNCAHAFNVTDLEAGMMMAHILLRDSPDAVPWAALQQARSCMSLGIIHTALLSYIKQSPWLMVYTKMFHPS